MSLPRLMTNLQLPQWPEFLNLDPLKSLIQSFALFLSIATVLIILTVRKYICRYTRTKHQKTDITSVFDFDIEGQDLRTAIHTPQPNIEK